MKQISQIGKSRFILFLLPLILATIIPPATAAGPSYLPGVYAGNQWTFGDWQVSCSMTCPAAFTQISGIVSLQILVQNVTGRDVGIKQTFVFYNGTTSSSTMITNTATSTSLFLIAGGLTKGDQVFNSTYAPTINDTGTRTYAGAVRPVNILDVAQSQTYGNFSYTFIWDQTTGALLDIREIVSSAFVGGPQNGGTVTLHARVTSTNLWSPTLPDFSLSSTPLSHNTISLGGSSSATITLTALQGLPGPEQVSAIVSPSITGHPQANVSPQSVPGTGTTTLSVMTTMSTAPGNYTVLVVADYTTTVSHFTTLVISVTGPDFTVAIYPSSLVIPMGSTQTAQAVLTSLKGFTGLVTLSANIAPAGLSSSFTPQQVTVPANGKVNSTLSITVPQTVSTTYFTGQIIAAGGSLSHTAFFIVYVTGFQPPDFQIVSPVTFLTLIQGSSTSGPVHVRSLNGFTGTVSLSSTSNPSGISAVLNQSSVTLPANGSKDVILTIQASTLGTYTVTITGISGSITHYAYVYVTVTQSGSPPTITSVTGITTNTHSIITILGTGFGNTPPQTVTVFDGSIDTVENATTPSIAIGDNCPSQGCAYGGTWEAGHKVQSNGNAIGIYLTSWSDTKIVINRFGSALSNGTRNAANICVVPSGWAICAGDPITIQVWGPNNSGVATFTVTATQGTKTTTTLSDSCSASSIDVGTFTTCTATATGDAPSGDVTFSTTSTTGTFTPTSAKCTLHTGACSVTYSDTAASSLTATIKASYPGDAYNLASTNNFALNVNKPASTTASATSSLSLTNGQATADQTSVTGISVKITGSGAGNGTPVAISTRDISSPSTGVGTVNLGGAKYYDVLVAGISDGNADVCINYASASSSTTMQYWNGATWTSASKINVNGANVCGQIPVSALKGTNIAVGTSIQSVSRGPLDNINLLLIIAGAIVAIAVVGVVAMVFLRRRGRAALIQPSSATQN